MAGERAALGLDRVLEALAQAGPARRPELAVPGATPAAVLVPLFEEEDETRVILTRRTTTLPSHRGEVAFPGGKAHKGEDLRAAALREAEEEVGLLPEDVEVVAELDHLTTVASRFVLAPFVGILRGRPALRPNPHEVDRVFDISLSELVQEDVFRAESWRIFGEERRVFFFELVGDTVWGATARVLHQLCTVVLTGMRGTPDGAL